MSATASFAPLVIERAIHGWQRLGGEFALPVFVIQGAEDFTTPTSLARSYLESITAPRKAFVAIEGNRLRIQTSVPLGEFVGHGRYYLNGDIVVESNGPESLENPRLSSITINNEPVPPDVLDWKYHARPLRDYLREYRRNIYGSGSFEIRDGKLIIDRRGGD